MSNEYTDKEIGEASIYKNMSPLYFRAQSIAKRFFEDSEEDVFEPLSKNVSDMVYCAINDKIAEWLLHDTESNLAHVIRSTVEAEVRDLLTGGDAVLKYIKGDRASSCRDRIFEVHSDLLKDERIKDLEDRVKSLEHSLRLRR